MLETKRARLRAVIESRLVGELVDTYPPLMPVLAEYGIDLCCGGELTLAEAAALHDIDIDRLIRRLALVLEAAEAAH